MSVISHRCVACGHPDVYHESDDGCSHGACGAHQPVYGPPELLPTYDNHGHRVGSITPPGAQYRAFARGIVDLCGCAACQALYASARDGAA